MNENVYEMKYQEVRQYAKDLGIQMPAPKPKKEQLIELIKEHFDKNKKLETNMAANNIPDANEEGEVRKSSRKHVKPDRFDTSKFETTQIANADNDDAENPDEANKKEKKTKKKITKKQKVKFDLDNEDKENVKENKNETSEIMADVKVKKVKKVKASKSNEKQAVLINEEQNEPEVAEENNQVAKKKTGRKTTKKVNSKSKSDKVLGEIENVEGVEQESVATLPTITIQPPDTDTEAKEEKKKRGKKPKVEQKEKTKEKITKKTKKSTKTTENEENLAVNNQQDNLQDSKELELKLDNDEDDEHHETNENNANDEIINESPKISSKSDELDTAVKLNPKIAHQEKEKATEEVQNEIERITHANQFIIEDSDQEQEEHKENQEETNQVVVQSTNEANDKDISSENIHNEVVESKDEEPETAAPAIIVEEIKTVDESLLTNDETDENIIDNTHKETELEEKNEIETKNKTLTEKNEIETKNKTLTDDITNDIINTTHDKIDLQKNEEQNNEQLAEPEQAEITRDIMNDTFDKSPKSEKSSMNRIQILVSEDKIPSTPQASKETVETVATATNSVTAVACSSFYNQQSKGTQEQIETKNEQTDTDAAKKPRTGGARIVRPKQTVSVVSVKEVDNKHSVEEVVVTKKIDIVQREAGPRIVKPVQAEQADDQSKTKRKKANTTESIELKKTRIVELPKKRFDLKSTSSISSTSSVSGADEQQASGETSSKLQTTVKKSRIVIPDFKSIHEKINKKMESIVDYSKRKQERTNELVAGKPIISPVVVINHRDTELAETAKSALIQKQEKSDEKTSTEKTEDKLKSASQNKTDLIQPAVKSNLKTPSSLMKNLSHAINSLKKTPNLQASTPKMTKTLKTTKSVNTLSQSTCTTANTHIPRFVKKKNEGEETETAAPKENEKLSALDIKQDLKDLSKTPVSKPNQETNTAYSKTPSSTVKISTLSLNKSIKKSNTFVFGNPATQTSSSSIAAVAAAPPPVVAASNLATSSFKRRKSYDLNASLAKPLAYNPHHGKLKPVDFNSKSIFSERTGANGEQKTAIKSTNLNETGILNTTSQAPKTPKISTTMKRLSSIMQCGLRSANLNSNNTEAGNKALLLQHNIRQHSKQITDKFRANEKKIRQQQKEANLTKNRQLDHDNDVFVDANDENDAQIAAS